MIRENQAPALLVTRASLLVVARQEATSSNGLVTSSDALVAGSHL